MTPKDCIYRTGEIVYLGHQGKKCPHLPIRKGIQVFHEMQVLHTNGVHNIRLVYCHCIQKNGHVQQLMESALFPSAPKKPRVALTFQVLNEFDIHSLQSKKSAYDYCLALERLTNGASPQDVPV